MLTRAGGRRPVKEGRLKEESLSSSFYCSESEVVTVVYKPDCSLYGMYVITRPLFHSDGELCFEVGVN